jgi:hypothetical protein
VFFVKKRKGGVAFLAMAMTLVIAMLALPVFASNMATLFAGSDALDQSIQAQQYALIEADILRDTAYGSLVDKTRADIANSEGYQREIIVGPEKTIDGKRQKIATVNIYRSGEAERRYALKVPLTGGG